MIGWILAVLAAAVLLWGIVLYNRLVARRNHASGVRYDLAVQSPAYVKELRCNTMSVAISRSRPNIHAKDHCRR